MDRLFGLFRCDINLSIRSVTNAKQISDVGLRLDLEAIIPGSRNVGNHGEMAFKLTHWRSSTVIIQVVLLSIASGTKKK